MAHAPFGVGNEIYSDNNQRRGRRAMLTSWRIRPACGLVPVLANNCFGRLYALMLTVDNVSNIKAILVPLERPGRMSYLLGDKGYNADGLTDNLWTA